MSSSHNALYLSDVRARVCLIKSWDMSEFYQNFPSSRSLRNLQADSTTKIALFSSTCKKSNKYHDKVFDYFMKILFSQSLCCLKFCLMYLVSLWILSPPSLNFHAPKPRLDLFCDGLVVCTELGKSALLFTHNISSCS